MIPISEKLNSFEYLVSKLVEWYKEAFGTIEGNDLSKLKVFKLHFFVTAISATNDDEGLLQIFGDFHALPYGPVESVIYSHLNELNYFRITNSCVEVIKIFNDDFIESIAYKDLIDRSIEHLKVQNFKLIKASAFDLVELSHSWTCWSLVFNYAKSKGKFASKIPEELIQHESKKVVYLSPDCYAF